MRTRGITRIVHRGPWRKRAARRRASCRVPPLPPLIAPERPPSGLSPTKRSFATRAIMSPRPLAVDWRSLDVATGD